MGRTGAGVHGGERTGALALKKASTSRRGDRDEIVMAPANGGARGSEREGGRGVAQVCGSALTLYPTHLLPTRPSAQVPWKVKRLFFVTGYSSAR